MPRKAASKRRAGLAGRRCAASVPRRGLWGRVERRKAGGTAAPGPVATRARRRGRPRPASKAGSARGSHTRPAAPELRKPPSCRRPTPAAPPAAPQTLSGNGFRPAELTASAARRLLPPSCTTASSLLFPPAPPPRIQRNRSPWHGGRNAPPRPTSSPCPAGLLPNGRRPWTNLTRAL